MTVCGRDELLEVVVEICRLLDGSVVATDSHVKKKINLVTLDPPSLCFDFSFDKRPI